jgi:hypothetical protein
MSNSHILLNPLIIITTLTILCTITATAVAMLEHLSTPYSHLILDLFTLSLACSILREEASSIGNSYTTAAVVTNKHNTYPRGRLAILGTTLAYGSTEAASELAGVASCSMVEGRMMGKSWLGP